MRLQAFVQLKVELDFWVFFKYLDGKGVKPVTQVVDEVLGWPHNFVDGVCHLFGIEVVAWVSGVVETDEIELVVAVERVLEQGF